MARSQSQRLDSARYSGTLSQRYFWKLRFGACEFKLRAKCHILKIYQVNLRHNKPRFCSNFGSLEQFLLSFKTILTKLATLLQISNSLYFNHIYDTWISEYVPNFCTTLKSASHDTFSSLIMWAILERFTRNLILLWNFYPQIVTSFFDPQIFDSQYPIRCYPLHFCNDVLFIYFLYSIIMTMCVFIDIYVFVCT